MALPFMPARAQEKKTADATKTSVPDTQIATPIFVETAPPPTAPKVNAQESSSDQEAKFTTSAFGMINRNSKFKLPDYIPAAHGNAVEIIPKHYFMLMPLGSTHKWARPIYPTNMDEILTIPRCKTCGRARHFRCKRRRTLRS
jgi:hypothetical protein